MPREVATNDPRIFFIVLDRMEQIKQAVERAKASAQGERLHPVSVPEGHSRAASRSQPLDEPTVDRAASAARYNNVALNGSHLEQHRIVAHNVADPRSKAFDMLRTQVLQAMDQKSWQVLAVTSPTEGCGKTVTAINLALSIARQPERSVLLVDLDLQRPSVANYLGIKSRQGVLSTLEGRTALPEGLVRAQVNSCELFVLPCEAATVHSSELIASRNMNTMLQDLKRLFRTQIIVFDMPIPMVAKVRVDSRNNALKAKGFRSRVCHTARSSDLLERLQNSFGATRPLFTRIKKKENRIRGYYCAATSSHRL